MTTKPRALAYLRVSTTMQSEEGISLDTQLKKIQDYCSYKGFELFNKIYKDEGLSGKNMERPELKKLLDDVQKDDYVIIYELSRLSRNTRDALNILEQINNKGGFLICLNPDIDFSSPAGKMMYTVLSAFHQLERETTSQRVSMNMKNLSKQNLLRSRPPFGYKFISKDKPMIEDEEQQKVVKVIKEKYEELKNITAVTEYLNSNGYNKCFKKEGQKFYVQTVKNILSDYGVINTNRKKISDKFLDTRKNAIKQ